MKQWFLKFEYMFFKGPGMSQGQSQNKKHKNIKELFAFFIGIYTQRCI